MSVKDSRMIIAVDFDGTLVEHRFPQIGQDVPDAFPWCLALQNAGARLILWTVRDAEYLTAAVEHCLSRGLQFWGINGNPDQGTWSTSPKVFAHRYIDDAALGVPLARRAANERPYVDWSVVGPEAMAQVLA